MQSEENNKMLNFNQKTPGEEIKCDAYQNIIADNDIVTVKTIYSYQNNQNEFRIMKNKVSKQYMEITTVIYK